MTRLLGQSPAGLSATGDSDTRNYYDMVSARQEADLRPKLERLDRLIARSEGLDPGALTFEFRPLWQLDAATAATVALQKAQATQITAGLGLWPAAVTARLVEAQLAEDGTYPNAAATFAEASSARSATATLDFDPDQPRDPDGRWTAEGGEGQASTPRSGAPRKPADPSKPASSTSAEEEAPAPGEQLQDPSAIPPAPDLVAESIIREATVTLAPLIALLALRGRATETARGLINRLLPWLTGGLPPDPPPSAEPVGVDGGTKSSAPSAQPADPQGSAPPEASSPALSTSSSDPPQTMSDLAKVTRGFAGPKSAQKWLNQMNDRGWTPEQIEEAISDGHRFPESQRIDPTHGATRYVHPRTGRSVTIDDVTGEVIQLGGDSFRY